MSVKNHTTKAALFLFACIVAGFLFYNDPDFLAFVKNSVHAWQQSIIDLSNVVLTKSKSTALSVYGAINFSALSDSVVPVIEKSKVVLQDSSKFVVEWYQSAAAFTRDVWNENFNGGVPAVKN